MVYRCNNCNYHSSSPQIVLGHCRRTGHSPQYQCVQCNSRLFVNAEALHDHLETAIVHCECPYCNKPAFGTRTALDQHIRDKHEIVRIVVTDQPNERTPLFRGNANAEEDTERSFSWRKLFCGCC